MNEKQKARLLVTLSGVFLGGMSWMIVRLVIIALQLEKGHPDNVWVKDAYSLKTRAITSTDASPKILIVGGSASMFGVDSSLLAEQFGTPVINFAVNAGIGTYALPALADPHISKGDVVLMPLEYRLLLWDGIPSYVTLSWVLEHPESLRRWRLKSLFSGLWQLPLKRALASYDSSDLTVDSEFPYGAHRLNSHGDQTFTHASERSEQQLAVVEALEPESYAENLINSKIGLQEWQFWWRQWRERGACLLVVPPPMLAHISYFVGESKLFFDSVPHRVRHRGVAYKGQPQMTFFPASAMFDTSYHLTAEARQQYTQWIIEVLPSTIQECRVPALDESDI